MVTDESRQMRDQSCFNPQSAIRNPQSPLTDSPWFWVLAFSAMALGALLAIGPKYGGRQARLERQYQARERILDERAGTSIAANGNDQAQTIEGQGQRRPFASADDTLIPLWPLAVILALVMIGSGVMLVRGRAGHGALVERGGHD
jgi:hypothetical protein